MELEEHEAAGCCRFLFRKLKSPLLFLTAPGLQRGSRPRQCSAQSGRLQLPLLVPESPAAEPSAKVGARGGCPRGCCCLRRPGRTAPGAACSCSAGALLVPERSGRQGGHWAAREPRGLYRERSDGFPQPAPSALASVPGRSSGLSSTPPQAHPGQLPSD